MATNTYTISQLVIADDLRDLTSTVKSIIMVIGTGACDLKACEACMMELQMIHRYAQDALTRLTRLTTALRDMGMTP